MGLYGKTRREFCTIPLSNETVKRFEVARVSPLRAEGFSQPRRLCVPESKKTLSKDSKDSRCSSANYFQSNIFPSNIQSIRNLDVTVSTTGSRCPSIEKYEGQAIVEGPDFYQRLFVPGNCISMTTRVSHLLHNRKHH